MTAYSKYATTVVGSYSVPRWYESLEKEVEAAVEAINLAVEGLKKTSVQVHVCQGNYAVGEEYDGQIGRRYFDYGRYPADLICRIRCDVLLVEHDFADRYEGLLGNKRLAVGAAIEGAGLFEVTFPRRMVKTDAQY